MLAYLHCPPAEVSVMSDRRPAPLRAEARSVGRLTETPAERLGAVGANEDEHDT